MKLYFVLRSSLQNSWLGRQVRYQKNVFTKPKRGSHVEKEKNMKLSMQQKIKENIEKAKKNVDKNTPKIIGGLFILFSIPQFKLVYDLLQTDYEDRRFLQKIRLSLDFINIKSALLIGAIFGLEAIKFFDNKAKYTMTSSKYRFLFLLIPFGFNLLSLSYFDVMTSELLCGNLAGDAGLFLLETKMTNEGSIPYWFFNIKYHVHIFDIINLSILYMAMRKLVKEMKSKPHKFLEIEHI